MREVRHLLKSTLEQQRYNELDVAELRSKIEDKKAKYEHEIVKLKEAILGAKEKLYFAELDHPNKTKSYDLFMTELAEKAARLER